MDSLLSVHVLLTSMIFTVIISLYFYFAYKANYWRRKGVKGPKALPLIGNLWDNFRYPSCEVEEQRLLKYGRVYGTLFGWTPVITIAEPELLKQVLITDFRVFMAHREMFPGDPFLSRMLNELTGDDWRRMKAIIAPSFSMHKLRKMKPLFDRCLQNTFKHFEVISSTNSEIDLKKAALCFTLDIIASCVFGMKTDGFKKANDEFIVISQQFAELKLWRALTSLIVPSNIRVKYDLQLFPKKQLKYFKYVLQDTIRKRKEQKKVDVDFLSILLNAEISDEVEDEVGNCVTIKDGKKKLTENEVMAQCLIFMIAGYETTSTTLNYALYNLAVNPKIQQTLHTEIHSYFENNKEVEFDSLASLPYLDSVLNETLRLYPPVTYIERLCSEDYKLDDLGITIEKGTILNIPYYAMHHDPQLFPNPHQFMPERFMPENRDNIQPYSFIPFGLGPRNCIGQRFGNLFIKIFLANFVNKFEILKTENTPEKPVPVGDFAFLNCEPLYATAKRRNI